MARPRRQEARRTQLTDAARQAVLERGLFGLRLGDVAEKAGMSPGSVLYYFPSLTELLQEVQREASGDVPTPGPACAVRSRGSARQSG